ncbi:MAG: DUF4412 domain-containing protein [Gemmatimonadales bacterium]
MNTTKLIPALLGAVTLGAVAPPAPAQSKPFEGAVTLRIRELPGEVQAYVKGARVRMEMQGPMGAMAMIMDPDTNETYMVVPAQQMVMVMKREAMARMADSLAKAAGVGEGTLTATGKQETVADHECEVYRYRDPKSVLDLCVARGLGHLATASLFASPSGGMGMGRGAPQSGAGRGAQWHALIADRGFPLRMADSAGVAIWEVTKIEPKEVDASLFVVPATYQRMEMPAFGRRPPQ